MREPPPSRRRRCGRPRGRPACAGAAALGALLAAAALAAPEAGSAADVPFKVDKVEPSGGSLLGGTRVTIMGSGLRPSGGADGDNPVQERVRLAASPPQPPSRTRP